MGIDGVVHKRGVDIARFGKVVNPNVFACEVRSTYEKPTICKTQLYTHPSKLNLYRLAFLFLMSSYGFLGFSFTDLAFGVNGSHHIVLYVLLSNGISEIESRTFLSVHNG